MWIWRRDRESAVDVEEWSISSLSMLGQQNNNFFFFFFFYHLSLIVLHSFIFLLFLLFSSLQYNRFGMLITVLPACKTLLSIYHLQPSLAFLLLRALNKRGHTALKSTVYRMAHSWQGKAAVPPARWSPTSLLSSLSGAHICLSECQSVMNINAQRWQRWIVVAAERRIS